MALSYHNHFKKMDGLFMKENFKVYGVCRSKYSSSDTNMLNRLKNSLVKPINNHGKFPKYIVLVLDMDLVDYLSFEGNRMVTLLGDMVEWITKKFLQLVKDRLELLPVRARKTGYPQIYWVAPLHHCNFVDNATCTKITNCLESVFNLYTTVRLIRMKEIWHYDNKDLVNYNGSITESGLTAYWKLVDTAVKFNSK